CGPPLVIQGALYGEVKASKWTKEFQCEGTESSLLGCRNRGPVRNTCSPGKAVGLTCSEPVRLVGGASRCEGLLEVKLGTWRPVNASNWTMKEAALACRELDCGSVVSMGTRNNTSVKLFWEINLNLFKSGSSLRESASSSSKFYSILELVCTDLLVQPTISVSTKGGVTRTIPQGLAGVLLGSSFTIICSIQPQYPGGSFQLFFTSANTTQSYSQPHINHSAHFLFPEAGPNHFGNYSCVYNVHVFFHNFS
ncbi:PREDICTED: scavenger receptor cysteine-rich type 1 protein M130-like, partial [Cyprinodon variegatus]|uniref:scavenger receptor cysteine-rich type 1 protein M130-like n=1 Tax=Cyprinodon variegatus TaxID=28743 RepID=UPI000742A058